MFKKIGITALVSTLAAGCASVPMESLERTTQRNSLIPHQMERQGYTFIVIHSMVELPIQT